LLSVGPDGFGGVESGVFVCRVEAGESADCERCDDATGERLGGYRDGLALGVGVGPGRGVPADGRRFRGVQNDIDLTDAKPRVDYRHIVLASEHPLKQYGTYSLGNRLRITVPTARQAVDTLTCQNISFFA
jgi:hypothetical protein